MEGFRIISSDARWETVNTIYRILGIKPIPKRKRKYKDLTKKRIISNRPFVRK